MLLWITLALTAVISLTYLARFVAFRENMVRQNMIEKGNSREESEVGIDLLLTILDCFRGADLRLGTRDGGTTARLEIQLELPEAIESGGDAGEVSRADGRADP